MTIMQLEVTHSFLVIQYKICRLGEKLNNFFMIAYLCGREEKTNIRRLSPIGHKI